MTNLGHQQTNGQRLWIEEGEDKGFAAKGTFINDPNQVVRQISINDWSVERSIDESLRLLEGCQFADKYGNFLYSL
jgi:peroxiredoxin 2/4